MRCLNNANRLIKTSPSALGWLSNETTVGLEDAVVVVVDCAAADWFLAIWNGVRAPEDDLGWDGGGGDLKAPSLARAGIAAKPPLPLAMGRPGVLRWAGIGGGTVGETIWRL